MYVLGFPGGSDGKESACNAEDPGSISGSGRFPGEGKGNPLQYSCLENSIDKRSLAGYSSWGRKELVSTKRLTTPSSISDQIPRPPPSPIPQVMADHPGLPSARILLDQFSQTPPSPLRLPLRIFPPPPPQLLAVPLGMWDLSYPSRDRAQIPCIGTSLRLNY